MGAETADSYGFGPFVLDVRRRRLFRDGEMVPITRKAIDTLMALVSRAGDVVEKEDLLKQVWPSTFVSEDTLTQNISTLRKALGDTAEVPEYIATVPRRGYRFVGLVKSAPVLDPRSTGAPEASADVPGTLADSDAAPRPAAEPARLGRERVWIALATLSTAAAVLFGVAALRPTTPASGEMFRFTVTPPRGWTLASAGVVSPDGRSLAFVARNTAGRRLLMARPADSLESIPLSGTDGAEHPFWAPDSRSLGFFAEGKLKKVDVERGPPVTLAEASVNPQGGTWNPDNVILYAPGRFSAIRQVPALGGPSSAVTALDEGSRQSEHWWPQFLPDGRHFLFSVASADPSRAGVYVGTLGSTEVTRLLDASAAGATYVWPGHLLFVRDDNLLAQPFDAQALRMSGTAVPLAAGVPPPDMIVGRGLSASDSGLLAYTTGAVGSRLTWFDRAGRVLSSIAGPSRLRSPALSPDERFVVTHRLEMGSAHLWLLELDRGVTSRLDTGAPTGRLGVWSPDSRFLVYSSDRRGSLDLYLRSKGGDDDQLLVGTPGPERAFDWSSDGRFIVYGTFDSRDKLDLWLLPMTGDRTPVPYATTPFNETQAQVAPNNRWLAYASDESGAWEVYLQRFPEAGEKHRMSIEGGAQPSWRADGRELYYLAPDGRLMAVAIEEGSTLEVGVPVPLFQTSVPGALDTYRNYYVATSDGQRFLVDSVAQGDSAIALLQHWMSGLPALEP